MYKRYRFIFLTLILVSYSLLYIATSKSLPCDSYCESMADVDSLLRVNRDYVYYATWCDRPVHSDSICVWVKDTSGIDWNLFADTVCQVATSKSLLQQKIFILKSTSTGFPDTVVIRQCP